MGMAGFAEELENNTPYTELLRRRLFRIRMVAKKSTILTRTKQTIALAIWNGVRTGKTQCTELADCCDIRRVVGRSNRIEVCHSLQDILCQILHAGHTFGMDKDVDVGRLV